MGKGIVKLGEGQWAVKDGNLLAAKETNGRFKNTEFTVSRGTDATYVDRDGLIVNETGDDTPRIDFTDNTDGHLLLEPQRTNYIEYSNDASQWSDVVSNGTITSTSNYALAPNGENEATRLQLNSTTGYALKSEATTSFNDDYYISIYLKSNTTENQEVTIYGRNSLAISYTVTTQWQRFEVSCNNSSGSAFFNFGCRPSQGSDADLDILAWGGQLEQGTYTTSYIPTNGSTVTRDAETCTGAGSSADFNSEEGVLYLEIAALANDGTNRPISIGDGTTSNVVRFYYSVTDNRIVGNVKSGGSSVFNYNNVLSDATDFIKVAVSYKADDYKMYVNGINVSTDTSGAAPIGLTELAFDNGAGTDNFYGKCKAIKVYKEALSDTDLENLTS